MLNTSQRLQYKSELLLISNCLISETIDSISNLGPSNSVNFSASEFFGKTEVSSHQKTNIPNFKVYQLSKIFGLDIKWFDESSYSFNVKQYNL